jgi:hypothetical protein
MEAGAAMKIRFWRSGSSSFGLEVGDDGIARSTLSSGEAVGRFARPLSPTERDALEQGLAKASAPARDDAPVAPGAATEHLLTDTLDVAYPAGGDPPDGLAGVVTPLRDLLDDLVASPIAAIVFDATGARLRHAGHEPITARMKGMTMTTTRFSADYAVEGSIEAAVDALHDGPIEPGWELALPDAGADAPEGGFVSITVGPAEIDVEGDGVLRRCEFGWTSE